MAVVANMAFAVSMFASAAYLTVLTFRSFDFHLRDLSLVVGALSTQNTWRGFFSLDKVVVPLAAAVAWSTKSWSPTVALTCALALLFIGTLGIAIDPESTTHIMHEMHKPRYLFGMQLCITYVVLLRSNWGSQTMAYNALTTDCKSPSRIWSGIFAIVLCVQMLVVGGLAVRNIVKTDAGSQLVVGVSDTPAWSALTWSMVLGIPVGVTQMRLCGRLRCVVYGVAYLRRYFLWEYWS